MTDETPDRPTHFGYREIAADEKAGRVAEVFDHVARRYDLMNDLMTWGLHRRWKRSAVKLAGIQPGDKVLDLAGGTGDIAIRLAAKVGPTGHVTLADINPSMLAEAERRLRGHRFEKLISLYEADAEDLPFGDASFDAVTIGFGLRNVTNPAEALASMRRVLKPGGRLRCPGVLQACPVARPAVLRRLLVSCVADPRQACPPRLGELSIPGRIHPHAPGPGRPSQDAEDGPIRRLWLQTDVLRHRRRAPR